MPTPGATRKSPSQTDRTKTITSGDRRESPATLSGGENAAAQDVPRAGAQDTRQDPEGGGVGPGAQIRAVAASGVRFHGVRALAREVGCSAAFLSKVLHGRKKPGERIGERLRAHGIDTVGGRRAGARAAQDGGGAG